MPPIFQTSTYVQESLDRNQDYKYSRSHNPTRTRLEECLASLENAKYALATSSGMSIIALLMHALKNNSTVLCSDDIYGGTYRLFKTVFDTKLNFIFTDTTDYKSLENTFKEIKPQMIWLETPTNPLLKITDIKKIVTIAKKYKTIVVVDNTFMSPIFQNPIDLGADIVIHSMTKYINGHSDVLGGCMMTNSKNWNDRLWTLQNSIGPTLSPFDSWLVLRGIKTLAIRMREHQENALEIAKYLELHPKIEKVLYPGLKSHPQYRLAKKQMRGTGGMISFYITGGMKESKRFLKRTKLFSLAESLGGVESLVGHPVIMTHASVPKEMRENLGLTENLIRLSVGIEGVKDLIDDLEYSLN